MIIQRLKSKSVVEINPEEETNRDLAIAEEPASELQVQFNILPEINKIDESRLVEITDSELLGHVNNLLPEAFKATTSASNAVHGNTKNLYEAILPRGKQLTKSTKTEGAYRGITMGKSGIDGAAEFVPVDNMPNVVANVASSAMSVGSMVVGQYYMTQINNELESISSDISQIADFQNNEYKSKVFALVTKVRKLSSFQTEILENEELRKAEILNLNRLEQQCIELLGQANLTIADYSSKMENYGINLEEGYRERYGVDGFLYKVPGMIRKELNYRPISQDVVEIVTKHLTTTDKRRQLSNREVFNENVKLIGKEGKVYYLPGDSI